jgi:hypothetical protein
MSLSDDDAHSKMFQTQNNMVYSLYYMKYLGLFVSLQRALTKHGKTHLHKLSLFVAPPFHPLIIFQHGCLSQSWHIFTMIAFLPT